MSKKYEIIKEIVDSLLSNGPEIRLKLFWSLFLFFLIAMLNLSLPWVFKYIVEILSTHKAQSSLIVLLCGYGLIWLLSNVSLKFREFLSYGVFERAISNFDLKVFKSLLHLPLHFYNDNHTGGIMNSIEMSQRSIAYILYGLFFSVIPLLFELALTAAIIAFLYGFSYMLLLLIFPLLYMFYSWLTMGLMVKKQRASSLSNKKFAAYVNDILLNIDGIHYQSAQSFSINKFEKISLDREYATSKKFELSSLIGVGQNIIAGIGLLFMTVIIGVKVEQGLMTIGDFVLFNGYLMQFITPLSALCNMGREVVDGLTKMENIIDVVRPKIQMPRANKAESMEMDNCEVIFKDVAFNYHGQEKNTLQDLSFILPFNKSIAIVGENGAGKSTVAKLLFRVLEPSKGDVFIGAQNIKDIDINFLRDLVAVVPQNIFILDDTVSENILFGNDIQLSDGDFKKIMQSIGIDKFIDLLPHGYETKIGERGVKISGGQRQLIGIARVLLKKPKILILDEATSALDSEIERKVFSYLKDIKNLTKIIITHDLKNLAVVEEVLYISGGELIQKGEHDDLLASCSGYKELFQNN